MSKEVENYRRFYVAKRAKTEKLPNLHDNKKIDGIRLTCHYQFEF